MVEETVQHHKRAPSALVFMARAFRPSAGLARDGCFPHLTQRWAGMRFEPGHLAAFQRATGLTVEDGVSLLYPHVLGFRLQMAVLTHLAFPLPIWTALQIRNRLVRHRPLDLDATFDLETRVGAHRLVAKGVEVDLVSRLSRGSECYWQSEITYFYRGQYEGERSEATRAASPDLSAMSIVDQFQMPQGGGWAFGRLTGDYNGIHTWSWYARRLGFRAAFSHPQRVTGLCLARLRGPQTDAQTLDLWIKGPVFYGAEVVLSAVNDDSSLWFGLALAGDPRTAIVGAWRGAVDQVQTNMDKAGPKYRSEEHTS